MMQAYADDAVRAARQQNIHLDYSEQSLEAVEHLMGTLHDELQHSSSRSSVLQTENEAGPKRGNQLDEIARTWGGYLGEVVRRRFGGEWTIEKYPAGDFLIVTLNVNGAKLFPAMKIHKRLTDGASENLLYFYRNVRTRLEAQPGGKLQ